MEKLACIGFISLMISVTLLEPGVFSFICEALLSQSVMTSRVLTQITGTQLKLSTQLKIRTKTCGSTVRTFIVLVLKYINVYILHGNCL